ncbi:MAG: (2Fe-2S)-binding protein [Phycisphaerales bacterium]|nr:MAG: (2Fe-2S)-binding protein [Phycisphaerales bacterium]
MKTVVNGKHIEVERDRWALDVLLEMGVAVPTLCHHPAVEPYGACRLCVVEARKGKWTWLTTSCDLQIREGLNIETDTPSVIRSRRMSMELILSRAPHVESLQRLAADLGVGRPRFGPHYDIGKCILCGLCVRVCDRLIGASAISFVGRGRRRSVTTPFGAASESCTGCGACIAVCPTGHIRSFVEESALNIETWNTRLEMIDCKVCGTPFTAAKLLESVQGRLGKGGSLERVCSKCRRLQMCKRLGEAFHQV